MSSEIHKLNAAVQKRNERIKELNAERERIAKQIHYPECWDTAAYPSLADAVCEIAACDPEQCRHKEMP